MSATTGGILLIGYGNELRGDDGVGPYVAREIDRRDLPGVRTFALHQLAPELAEEIAGADGVIFVDAEECGASDEIVHLEVEPADTGFRNHPCNSWVPSVAEAKNPSAFARHRRAKKWFQIGPGEVGFEKVELAPRAVHFFALPCLRKRTRPPGRRESCGFYGQAGFLMSHAMTPVTLLSLLVIVYV
jgi:hypothetical protein